MGSRSSNAPQTTSTTVNETNSANNTSGLQDVSGSQVFSGIQSEGSVNITTSDLGAINLGGVAIAEAGQLAQEVLDASSKNLGVTVDLIESTNKQAFTLGDEALSAVQDIAYESILSSERINEDFLNASGDLFSDAIGVVSDTTRAAVAKIQESTRSDLQDVSIKLVQAASIVGGLFIVSRFLKN